MDIRAIGHAKQLKKIIDSNQNQYLNPKRGEAPSAGRALHGYRVTPYLTLTRQCLCGLFAALPFHFYCGALCYAPVAIAAIFIFRHIEDKLKDKIWTNAGVWILSLLFTLFVVIGDSCWCELHSIPPLPARSRLLVGAGICITMVYALSFIFSQGDYVIKNAPCIETANSKAPAKGTRLLKRRPFLAIFTVLCIFYIPLACLLYPGILMAGSSFFSIVPAFPGMNLLPDYYGYHAYSPMVLNNHHPVVHTLLLHYCIRAGHYLVDNASAGLFAYTLIQVFFCLSAIAYALSSLYKRLRLKSAYILLTIIYFLLHPIIVSYMFVPTKDVIYSGFMLYFVTLVGNSLTKTKPSKTDCSIRYIIGLCMATTGVVLFRSEGILVASTASIFLFCSKPMRKIAALVLTTALITTFAKNGLMQYTGVVPGMAREAFSVPVQQTARFLKEFPEDVTTTEKEALRSVCPIEKQASLYNSQLSDPVKFSYASLNSNAEKKMYLKAWFTMGMRHPHVYCRAFLMNHFLSVYPHRLKPRMETIKGTDFAFERINRYLTRMGYHFSRPAALYYPASCWEKCRDILVKSPLGSLLISPALYLWALCILAAFSLRHRCIGSMAFMIPLCAVLVVHLLGPCNADHVRYYLPLYFCLPIYIPYLVKILHSRHEQ